MQNILDIIFNLGMLTSLSMISGFIGCKGEKFSPHTFVQGLLFGFAAFIGMLNPLVLSPGLIFDGRSVMLSLCGLYFGPIAACIAIIPPLVLRFWQGGQGAITGILVILSSALFGVIFYRLKENQKKWFRNEMIMLFVMGICVHIAMLLLMFTLPDGKGLNTIKAIGLPVMLTYPIATVFIGKILHEISAYRHMTENLKISEQKLRESHNQIEATLEEVANSEITFRSIFENSTDTILIFEENIIQDCNQAALTMFGFTTKDSIVGRHVESISPEYQDDGSLSKDKAIQFLMQGQKDPSIRFEWTHKKSDETLFHVEVVVTKIMLHGKSVGHSIVRDISERKLLEKRLKHLSYHDQLTEIYNRRFFEEEVQHLNVARNHPLTLMMADVNGLKLINDSFGHETGDLLLKKVAKLLHQCCREGDVVSRIGGDEFVILLPKTHPHKAEEIAERIQLLIATEKIESLEISVSLGWAAINSVTDNYSEVLKQAEDYLYRKKLFESPSMHSKSIQTIIHTLHEKNKREELHSYRVSMLCEGIGKAMGFNDIKLKELKNLGLLHDIGKIAIDEHMLNKPGKLNEEEWYELTKHPEIGYRILSTVNEMSEMAESVLCHHERYDGKGYPRGIKGSNIPINARIITVADAYDAMTCDRPYRSALSHEFAVEELKVNSGSQFDPLVVSAFFKMMEETDILTSDKWIENQDNVLEQLFK